MCQSNKQCDGKNKRRTAECNRDGAEGEVAVAVALAMAMAMAVAVAVPLPAGWSRLLQGLCTEHAVSRQ